VTTSTTGPAPPTPLSAGETDFAALAPGKTIGRYEIVSILGQGGFGITYRARDDQLHREVAIKEYLPSALAIRQDGVTVLPRSTKVAEDFSWGRQRFVDEGRTLATLQRAPAIVRVFDFLEANGTAYIVMELVPGHTLEDRLKNGPLTPPELDKILWPLLDGLEQVHATGFLHRDIKPANILLDAQGNPTLIDFGASRAAMAGRTSAMTAIFTPGYAAAEQMTAAKQGPWSDIYGLSATLYHAITGAAPPNAFDRMLDDDYQPLGQLLPADFTAGLLVGLDAGLAVRASDRPQSIAGWRPILGQSSMAGAQATIAMTRSADANATVVVRQPTVTPTLSPPAKSSKGLWIGLGALIVLALGAGGTWFATRPPAVDVAAQAKATQQQDELDRLRADKAKRDQQAHDEEIKSRAVEDERKRLADEQTAKEAREAERKKALEADRTKAAEAEARLGLSVLDRQHDQVALTSLGFATNRSDGVFAPHTHDMIAAWQKSRGYPETGYLTGLQHQELLKAGAAAIAKFDDDQKKATAAAATPPPQPVIVPKPAPAAPSAGPASPADGNWNGTYQCTPSRNGGPFTMPVHIKVEGGRGVHTVPGATATSPGNHAIAITVTGKTVLVERTFMPTGGNNVGAVIVGTMNAVFEGGTITGTAPEFRSGGRNCTIILTR
jgi:serine/threonine protein kinase/peptidoglycan hydrolase-like protein with peptidoglycan-binding domain